MADCSNPNDNGLTQYVPPPLCSSTLRLQVDSDCGNTDANLAEQYAAEALEIAGTAVNVFKLLGIHEQGKLIDLAQNGYPLSSGTAAGSNINSAFDMSIGTIWRSSVSGADVLNTPAYLGYYFGIKKTQTGTSRYGSKQFILEHVTSIKIKQSNIPTRRATRLRLDRADGSLTISTPSFAGAGNGQINSIQAGFDADAGVVTVMAINATQFNVFHSARGFLGVAQTTERFNNGVVSFNLTVGAVPFVLGDTFTFELELNWIRVDIKNVQNTDASVLVTFKQSVRSPYWRIVPLEFTGVATNEPWEIDKLEMMEYEQTNLDNIQDIFFQENRDRDYAHCSTQLRAQYIPFDALGDLGKFGLSILDQYTFTVSFAKMVEMLGRPIVVGDILELPAELQWDHNMKPVKKFLEVTDAGWSSEGYTPGWKPILYRFQAVQMTPSQENRDIVGTADTYLNNVSDGSFFDSLEKQISTANTEATKYIAAEAKNDVPEAGQDPMDIASATALLGPTANNPHPVPDNHDLYIEDGLPPDGLPYGEGYKLPDVSSVVDGEYFRLNYPQNTGIPSRLYKFNGIKGRWQYVETDRRMEGSSFKKSVRKAFSSGAASIKD